MPYTIEQIEDALITYIDALKASLGVLTVDTYQGELSDLDVHPIDTALPAIYVAYAGSESEEHGMQYVELIAFSVFICDKSFESNAEARRGGDSNPGTYAMLRGVRDIVHGSKVGLSLHTSFHFVSEESLWAEGGLSVYGAVYEASQRIS